eukprot:TRINITY_DN6591_c0_g1_i2.p1 TRINITY_DN6591_c0_g1~~TRINITY_DN6591_c0_g1_i2.p1  ORF type:complete len:127 (+),score=19.58 TRINITY_DN6591_c0_g1_i2:40-420(+)
MTFCSHARWAFARNAHCSSFARNLNNGLRLGMHRGIASSPVLRLAAEYRPLGGFAEQRSSVSGLSKDLCSGEEVDETGSVVASQAVAAILDGIAKLDGSVPSRFGEMLSCEWLSCHFGSIGYNFQG